MNETTITQMEFYAMIGVMQTAAQLMTNGSLTMQQAVERAYEIWDEVVRVQAEREGVSEDS